MKKIITLSLISLSMSIFSATQTLVGKAYDTKSNLIYIEKHIVTYDSKVRKSNVKYYSPEKKDAFAELELDFTFSERLPNSKFQDFRSGRTRTIKHLKNENKIKVETRKSAKEDVETEIFKVSPNLISAYGLDSFIRDNFSELSKKGASRNFTFIVPSRLETYKFKIVTNRISETEVEFKAKVSNWFARMFAPEIKLIYSKADKRFIRYEGLSGLLDPDNKEEVVVKFSYE